MTDSPMEGAIASLEYELSMFVTSRDRWREHPEDHFWRNAAIEVHALHFRTLADFFTKKGTRRDDIDAQHFVPGWTFLPNRRDTEIGKLCKRVDKELAHITSARPEADSPLKNWDDDLMSAELRPFVKRFLTELPKGALPPSVIARLEQI